MPSTIHTSDYLTSEGAPASMRWRSWPLVDNVRWSWLGLCGFLAVGSIVWYVGGSALMALAAIVALAGASWQFFVPVRYEIDTLGLRRSALRRTRLIPWHAVRSFQLRPHGIVLYQNSDPTSIDVLRSFFVPYPADEDAMICAMREQLQHAAEVD